jgi:hypothetical protein
VTNSSINVLFNVSRETDNNLLINSRISNNTPIPITSLTLQIAASKVSKNYPRYDVETHYCRVHSCSLNLNQGSTLHQTKSSASHKRYG